MTSTLLTEISTKLDRIIELLPARDVTPDIIPQREHAAMAYDYEHLASVTTGVATGWVYRTAHRLDDRQAGESTSAYVWRKLEELAEEQAAKKGAEEPELSYEERSTMARAYAIIALVSYVEASGWVYRTMNSVDGCLVGENLSSYVWRQIHAIEPAKQEEPEIIPLGEYDDLISEYGKLALCSLQEACGWVQETAKGQVGRRPEESVRAFVRRTIKELPDKRFKTDE